MAEEAAEPTVTLVTKVAEGAVSGLTSRHTRELARDGYTIVRSFLDRELTAALRAHTDALLARADQGSCAVRDLRHPIPGRIMGEALRPELIAFAAELLRSRDLRLLEQVLIRTDPSPGPAGAQHWHIDMAFTPANRWAAPRQTYYHHVHALSTVTPGAGAFMIVPGSHLRAYAVAEQRPELLADPLAVAGIDAAEAIEVCPSEGDLLIFDPMSVHSASRNVSRTPRYVYFASFLDPSAEHLRERLHAKSYKPAFHADLVRYLDSRHPRMLDW
jgi:ectoine hydroxylase-related dioxygenase (phytanoyl-CoA dioxygenase family)